jgi:glycosyltransferase involved in cell wall biosynthesis
MLPLADYMALGMFDTYYAPAYYEDTDLAFKVRAAGKKVYYQPLARVIHFEGISNGTDLTGGGIKEYQRTNHHKFFTRWEETLKHHRPNARLPHLEKERHVDKRVLVVDARVLMPDHDSGSLRMFNLLQIFRQLGYKVSFIPDNLQYHEKYTPMMQALGIECFYHPYIVRIHDHLEAFGAQYQVVLLSRADYAEKYIDDVVQLCPQAQILFDTVDLHFLREQRLAALTHDKGQQEAATLRKLQELGIARKAHKTLVVSPVEVELFRQEAPDVQVALLSNIHAAEGRKAPWHERNNILFIGSFEHPPNADAMHWFIDEVFPLLHKLKPALKLLIVGGGAPKSLLAKARSHIEFTGFVADIAPLFNSIRLSIAPLRYGAGVKGKINSSMAYGVPVIASTVAAEGMGLVHGRDVLIADDAEGFARLITQAYDDEKLWYALSDAGLANIERCFSFAVATQQLREILER